MSERRKIQDVIDTLKRAIETRNLANALALLETLAKEAGVYVKLRNEDVLALYYELLPYNTGYQVVVVLKSGITITYDIFREYDYVDKVQVYIKRV
jgi:hypothetical protein